MQTFLGRQHRHRGSLGFLLLVAVLGLTQPGTSYAQEDNDTCFMCHDDDEFEVDRNGESILLYVGPEAFATSVHGEFDCTDCHEDASEDHPERLEKVLCGNCHDDVQLDFDASSHGLALNRNAPFAPECRDCHGVHDIRRPTDPESKVYKTNIPYTCGRCHREGAPVATTYDLYEHDIVENYSQSIHGEGLFKKGLKVTATCSDCHGSHSILPHTDPRATIAPRNIAATCMECHAQIEDVHARVIRGELWESEPGAIPACTDCHRPHLARKETVTMTVSDNSCLKCHDDRSLMNVAADDTVSLFVDAEVLRASAHATIPCVKCHSDVDPRKDRPCEPASTVDCSNCHAQISVEYYASGHGVAHLEGQEQAPYCTSCHGSHDILRHSDENSLSYRANVPSLCGSCHVEDGKANEVADLSEKAAFTDYSLSVHGKGLTEKGLLPSAICIDCHSSHMILDSTDNRSTVYPKNLPATCAICHRGIYKDYIKSVHYRLDEDDEHPAPSCARCHSSHSIAETERDDFSHEVTEQCGSCHTELSETYRDTMHGKAWQLGREDAAKCSDCHGAHLILANDDPESSVGYRNIVQTCQQCHEDANARFTGYLTHATHHDPDRYPYLYYTYWAMTLLLIGVFSFFGLHSLMWLPRSFRVMRQRRAERKSGESRHYVRRFTRQQQLTHLFVIVSFLSLALTGMMLKFSGMEWARSLANLLGGVRNAGLIHRAAAIMTFGYFALHITGLVMMKRRRKVPLKEMTLGPNAMMFNARDLKEFVASVRWFLGKGPRPQYGRWTYWEKFDYLAVFWGVAVIGASGLMLWFPEFFTLLLPGWVINVATIIHSDEALLAVGFIFTVHFFNTHLRPEAFPMDTVIFTGVVPYEHYKHDRPRAITDLKEQGLLKKTVETQTISVRRMVAVKTFGYLALALGTIMIGLILYSVLFGYK
jgi:predicted CXXCH cytochrome family protein